MSASSARPQLVGVAFFLLLVLSWPASCEWRWRSEREETEAICRRTIERNFKVPAADAATMLKDEREWEGR